MKKLLKLVAFVCLSLPALAQNLATVSASNIQDLNGAKLAAGQLCFLGTDNNDNPISFQVGGGGQVLKRSFCSAVTAGVVTSFTVPNPANTSPTGIYYRVTVKDSSTGVEVLRYTGVTFSGGTFGFDTYTPNITGASFSPLSGTSVTGNLSVSGNISASGTVTGSNIPSNILQQIFSSGTGQTQRTSVNFFAGITCSDNAGTTRTDCRLGTLNTVTFSATPTFDASTASTFKLTLTGNVTSSTLSNAVAGEPLAFEVCQDATGGRTFVPPTNVLNWVTIPSAINACVLETFIYDGTNALADGDTAGQVLAQDGTNSAPSISFENQTNSGWFRQQANILGLSINGTYVNQWTTVRMGNIPGFSIGWAAGPPNSNADDVNISRISAGVIGVGTGAASSTAGEIDARTYGVTGSSSGTTKIVAPATASGTLTLPATTDTVAVLGTFAAPPSLGNTTPAAVNATTLTTTGLATKYNNVNTVGNGLSATYGADDKTAQSASIGAVTLLTGGASTGGRYMLNGFLGITTSDASGATVSVTITWTQDGIARTATTTAPTFGSTVNALSLSSPMFVDASTNVTYSTTVTGSPTTGRYGIHVWLSKY